MKLFIAKPMVGGWSHRGETLETSMGLCKDGPMSLTTCTNSTRISITDHDGRERSALLEIGQTGPIRIGRASENDIQIVSPYISRLHG